MTRNELVSEITSKLREAERVGTHDAFGFGREWRSGDTTSFGDGLAVMADEADFLLGSKRFDADARSWLGNMLGANPWGVSLIIGAGDTLDRLPAAAAGEPARLAYGRSARALGCSRGRPHRCGRGGRLSTMRACPPQGGDRYARFNGNDGRFVGSKRAVYKDNVQSYTTTEPAIDLTATSFLAFAWRQAGGPAPLGGP